MENHPEVPPEFYGKWWKIINEEFGEIVQEKENENSETQNAEEERENRSAGNSAPIMTNSDNSTSQTARQDGRERLSREENDNLADYLRIGMSLKEAREAFEKEIEMAELKQRIRESKRDHQRGMRGDGNRTTLGNTYGAGRGGRGGLSFN